MEYIHNPTGRRSVSGSRFYLGVAALTAALAVSSALPTLSQAQVRLLGTLVSVDSEAGVITLRTDEGKEAAASYGDSTRCLLVPPGETSLQKATPIPCAEIQPGDRALARGQMRAAGEPVEADLVVIMSRTALEQKREADLEAWRTRGVYGRVVHVDPKTGEIAIRSTTLREKKDITLEVADDTRFRRYPVGKFRYADAVASSLDEIREGDQLQVLGEKNEDGSRVRTEEVLAGSFRTFAATILEVDAEANRLKVRDLDTGKTLTVLTGEGPNLRRLPERMARMLSMVIGGNAPGGPGGGGINRGPGGGRGDRGGFPGGGGGGRGFSFQQILSRAPEFALGELEAGEPLIVSATDGADDVPRVAIIVLAGVEPLLAAASANRGPVGGNWNFDVNVVE